MKVSVVICCYSLDRLPDTLEAVDSVLRQGYHEREVILVVDSNPRLYERLRERLPAGVKVVQSLEGGLSAARNVGVRVSEGEVVAFTDDDALAAEDWLARLVENYSDPQVMAVGGRALPLWEGGPATWLPEELFWVIGCTHRGYADGRRLVRNIHGNNMSFRRGVFERVGYFSPMVGHNRNLLGGDETEFCLRVVSRLPGAKILYDPAAVVYHRVPRERCTAGHLLRRAYGEGVSKAWIRSMVTEKGVALADEGRHLRHLATSCAGRILKMLTRGRIREGLGQGLAVFLAVAATGLGYAVSRFRLFSGRGGAVGRR